MHIAMTYIDPGDKVLIPIRISYIPFGFHVGRRNAWNTGYAPLAGMATRLDEIEAAGLDGV